MYQYHHPCLVSDSVWWPRSKIIISDMQSDIVSPVIPRPQAQLPGATGKVIIIHVHDCTITCYMYVRVHDCKINVAWLTDCTVYIVDLL